MKVFRGLMVAALVVLGTQSAYAQIIDDFEGGDLSQWNIESPWYTALSIVSPGAGGSANALQIQEITGSTGSHSSNALAHRNFPAPANWSGYSTLEMDAKITLGEWSGYSIRIYNNDQSVLLRGIHAPSTSGFQTVRFDISGIQRSQITEIVVYVNRLGQDAGQALVLDNIRLSNTPVNVPSPLVLENFSSDSLARWTAPLSPPYQAAPTLMSENSASDPSTPARALDIQITGTSQSALVRWCPAQSFDLNDYQTLQFDAKLVTGAETDGFSVRVYNAGAPVLLRKFVPATGGAYAVCQVDISEIERDQVNEIIIYPNRVGAYNITDKPVDLRIDNIRVSTTALPPEPNVVFLDTFDDANPLYNWDWTYQTSLSLESSDFVSAPYSMDIDLLGTSTSAYARRSFILDGKKTQDWEGYKSLMFEAKVLKGKDEPNYPVGFSANVVSGPANSQLWFYPSGYDQWETIALDLTGIDVDQVSWLRYYMNRSHRDDVDLFFGLGQIFRMDNLRLSKEPAEPVVTDDPNVDDFEDGDISDWYYTSFHQYPPDSGEYLDGVIAEVTTDAASGDYALMITHQTPPGSTSAYGRKTMQQNWSSYRTLEFDAKVADSATSSGYEVRLRGFSAYGPFHEFWPTTEWQTFRIDISSEAVLNEVIGMLFYVNRPGAYGDEQDGAQKLFLDNIRVTNQQVQVEYDEVGQALNAEPGSPVSLQGKISTGYFPAMVPDKTSASNLRPVFFLEEPDRSAAIPVVIAASVDPAPEVPAGAEVDVKGIITFGYGTRYLYASEVTVLSTGNPIPDPLVLQNKRLGSEGEGLDPGVPDFLGLKTVGLLVEIAGEVTAVGEDPTGVKWLYINDGSDVEGANGNVGVKVLDLSAQGTYAQPGNVGRFVKVTGFVMNDPEWDPNAEEFTGRPVRALWPKMDLANPFEWVN